VRRSTRAESTLLRRSCSVKTVGAPRRVLLCIVWRFE